MCPTWGCRYAGDRHRLDELEHREAEHAEHVRDWQALIDKAVVEAQLTKVRQLRHHFGPSLRDTWALYHPTHAVYCALLGHHAYWMLIGACDPML